MKSKINLCEIEIESAINVRFINTDLLKSSIVGNPYLSDSSQISLAGDLAYHFKFSPHAETLRKMFQISN
jgi:hypothetical protein